MSMFIPNAFQVPNAFVDVAMSELSDNALRCYLVIVRKTVGWNKEMDVISLSQFEKATGKSRHSVLKGINELLALNLISKVEVKTKAGKMNAYALLKNEQSLQQEGAEFARGAKCASNPVHSLHTQSNNIQTNNIQRESRTCARPRSPDISDDENFSPQAEKTPTPTKSASFLNVGSANEVEDPSKTPERFESRVEKVFTKTETLRKKTKSKIITTEALKVLNSFNLSDNLREEFLQLREFKKAPVTTTVLTRLNQEATKANISLDEAIGVMIEMGWRGFKAEWYARITQNFLPQGKSNTTQKLDPAHHFAHKVYGKTKIPAGVFTDEELALLV